MSEETNCTLFLFPFGVFFCLFFVIKRKMNKNKKIFNDFQDSTFHLSASDTELIIKKKKKIKQCLFGWHSNTWISYIQICVHSECAPTTTNKKNFITFRFQLISKQTKKQNQMININNMTTFESDCYFLVSHFLFCFVSFWKIIC